MKIQTTFILDRMKYHSKLIDVENLEETRKEFFDQLENIHKLEMELDKGGFLFININGIRNGIFIIKEVK